MISLAKLAISKYAKLYMDQEDTDLYISIYIKRNLTCIM